MRELRDPRIMSVLAVIVLFANCFKPQPGHVKDESLAPGRPAVSLPAAHDDYFADMDYGVTEQPNAVRAALDPYLQRIDAADAVKHVVRGRNNWIVWTAGNNRLWDVLSASVTSIY